MQLRRYVGVGLVAGILFSMSAVQSRGGMENNIKHFVCEKLEDFEATMSVVSADQKELNKIGRDFGFVYRFKSVNMRYKEPNKVRIEGDMEGTRGVYILNGPIQYLAIPKIHLKTHRDF